MKKRKRYYYKFVEIIGDGFHSCVLFNTPDDVRYKIEEWVSANNKTPLFVFKTRREALNWTSTIPNCRQLWRCEIKKRRTIRTMLYYGHRRSFDSFWKGEHTNLSERRKAPLGTFGAEEVKLVSMVKV